MGASGSDIWEEEEKKTRAKLISVWATFSGALSFPLRHIKNETQTQPFTASIWQSRGFGGDKSSEAAFVFSHMQNGFRVRR